MRSLICLLIFVIVCNAAGAQKIVYHLHDCVVSDTEKVNMEKMARFEAAFFSEIFGSKSEAKINMHVFSDTCGFRWAQRLTMFYVHSPTGVYNPVDNQIFMIRHSQLQWTGFHEMSHALYHHYSWRHPVWLDEGIAYYFKFVLWDSLGNPSIGRGLSVTLRMKSYVQDSTFSIKKVLRCSYNGFHRKAEGYHYDMSWGLVFYLNTYHHEVFTRIVARSKSPGKSYDAVEEEYKGGVAQLEKDLKAFYSAY